MDPTDATMWAKYAACASAVAAFSSVIVAFLQLTSTSRQHKIALFDKRLAIYDQINSLVLSCLAGTWNYLNLTTYREYEEWLRVRKEAMWMFPDELNAWLKENIGDAFAQYMVIHGKKIDSDSEEERRIYAKQLSAHRKKLSEAHDIFKDKFSPYLKLEK